jgi:hypothetical protein
MAAIGGCGGGDDGGSGGSNLFVLDAGNRAFGSMVNANPTAGTAVVDRIVVGPSTGLGTGSGTPTLLPDLALDAAGDRLYVAARGSVLVWDNAGLADGDQPRSRIIFNSTISDPTARQVDFFKLFIDTANNRLYAAEPTGDVQVYNGASGLAGSPVPNRSIKPNIGAAVFSTFGVEVDLTRDRLYVGMVPSGGFPIIAVYENQSTIAPTPGTAVAPDRTLTFPNAGSFYLDSVNDRLYVAASNVINVYDSASTLATGTPPLNRSFQLGFNPTQKHIFVDVPNNRLYGVSDNTVFIIPNASTANGLGVVGTVIQVQTAGSQFSAVATKP